MSEQNVLLVRAGYEAWNKGGVEAILPAFHEEIAWHSPFPEEASFTGHDGVRDWFASLMEVWANLSFHPNSYKTDGDDVVVNLRVRGIAKASGIEVEMPMVQRWTVEGGKAVAMDLSIDSREAPIQVSPGS